ncbi:hypothetical protein Dimus_023580 [Dionaea muscipula]
MAFSAPPPPPSSSNAAAGSEASRKAVSLFKNAAKRKHSFIQFFAMTGILLVSVRSLGQKYRLHDLQEDTYALKGEQEAFTKRMNHIKSSLLHEASLDSTGLFASRLRALFGEDHQ